MATIVERKRKDGKPAFLVQITKKAGGVIIHREAKTFDSRREAQHWGKWREAELEDPAAMVKVDDPTLAEAIQRYEREARRLGRTKASVLRLLRGMDIAKRHCSTIKSEHIVSLARDLSKDKSPATVAEYLTFLNGVFKVARPAWGYPLDETAMSDALVVAKKFELAGRSEKRERRPSLAELDKLLEFFEKQTMATTPMVKLAVFAIYSARREGEIVRIRWDDLDEAHGRILVRDMKDPKGASGNHTWVELPVEALRVIQTMPRNGERIFPFKGDTINVAWRNACRMLEIEDLRFHDLRHEGVSRLFEMGHTIPQVASVSGHRSWQNLQRYTHLRQTGDKYAGWPWLEKICKAKKSTDSV